MSEFQSNLRKARIQKMRMKKEYTEFNKNLKACRERQGYTANEMATYLNITPAAYGAYELGKREPSFFMLVKIAKTLNVSTDELLGMPVGDGYKRGFDDGVAEACYWVTRLIKGVKSGLIEGNHIRDEGGRHE